MCVAHCLGLCGYSQYSRLIDGDSIFTCSLIFQLVTGWAVGKCADWRESLRPTRNVMSGNQQNVEGYLRSAGFNLLNTDQGFLAADKPGVGGDRDTLLVWLPRQLFPDRRFSQFEGSLFSRLERDIERYPDARYTVLVDSLEEISRPLLNLLMLGASRYVFQSNSSMRHFAYKSPEATSAIK